MVQKRLEVEPVDWLTAEPVVMVPLFSFFSSLGSEVTEEHTEEDWLTFSLVVFIPNANNWPMYRYVDAY